MWDESQYGAVGPMSHPGRHQEAGQLLPAVDDFEMRGVPSWSRSTAPTGPSRFHPSVRVSAGPRPAGCGDLLRCPERPHAGRPALGPSSMHAPRPGSVA